MCKALLRICGKAINVPVYAPKAVALPTALHPERFRFVLFDGHGRRHGGKADAVLKSVPHTDSDGNIS